MNLPIVSMEPLEPSELGDDDHASFDFEEETCEVCDGAGGDYREVNHGTNHWVGTEWLDCEECDGTGRIYL